MTTFHSISSPSSASCPGFLDQYGIWNNGFDCALPRICCGTETNRYCCFSLTSSTSPSTPVIDLDDLDAYDLHGSEITMQEKWFLLQLCSLGIFLAILLLAMIIVYLCLGHLRRNNEKRKKRSFLQLPLPVSTSPLIHFEDQPAKSNRVSTISSHLSSDTTKTLCTETSTMFHTPLNLYPISNSGNSTSSPSPSSYYFYPNEFEYLCK